MKKNHRHITAVILTAIYCLIALTPLSPLALKSARIAHAVTGECSGDCDIDGCSLESRASHSCCCWQKKLKQAGLQQKVAVDSCCAPSAAVTVTPAPSGGCCATAAPAVDATSSCCAPSATEHDVHEPAHNAAVSKSAMDTAGQTVFKCGNPCGSKKVLALVKLSTDEIIPYRFVAALTPVMVSTLAATPPPPLASRSLEPPEPPPRLQLSS